MLLLLYFIDSARARGNIYQWKNNVYLPSMDAVLILLWWSLLYFMEWTGMKRHRMARMSSHYMILNSLSRVESNSKPHFKMERSIYITNVDISRKYTVSRKQIRIMKRIDGSYSISRLLACFQIVNREV